MQAYLLKLEHVMGNTTISTKDTEIYYPSDWLIEGGPTFESMNCPKPDVGMDDTNIPLTLVYNQKNGFFGVVMNGFILMESKDARDLTKYISDYVQSFQEWVAENES